MALLFIDSFDHYQDTEINDKWTTAFGVPTIVAGAGRCDSAAAHFDFTANMRRAIIPGSNRLTVGFAFKVRSEFTAFSIPMAKMGTTAGDHFRLQWNFSDGSLELTEDGGAVSSIAVSAPGIVQMDTWYYIELQALMSQAATGEIIVRVNEIEVLHPTGIVTVGSDFSGLYEAEVRVVSFWGYSNRQWYCDDVYVLDSTGSAPCNDFLGDCKVEYLRPNAAGTYQQWTPTGAATNWQAVDDDATPDEDGSYVESVTPNEIDTNNYEPTGLPSGTIFGAQLSLHAKKSEVGPRVIAPVANAVVGSPIIGVSAESYQYWLTMYQNNPTTGLPWTITEINAAQFGVKVVS